MAKNALEIINRALVKIGTNPIQGFEENSAESMVAKEAYSGIRDAVLSAYPWSFATKIANLTKLVNPRDGQRYTFLLPPDMLRLLSIDTKDYTLLANTIVTQQKGIRIQYVCRPEEVDFPPFFDTVLVAKIAAEFCLPITDSTTRTDFLSRQYEKEFKIARYIDTGQNVIENLNVNTLVDVRQ